LAAAAIGFLALIALMRGRAPRKPARASTYQSPEV
jgi:hypothetical protein